MPSKNITSEHEVPHPHIDGGSPAQPKTQKIAIICDWLIDSGGAELVISHLLELYPDADIYTSVCFMDHPMLEGRRVYTSWLQKIPFFNKRHKLSGILRPWAFRSFDLSGYDIVICSSSAESKQVAMGKWNSARHPDKGRIQECNTETLDSSQSSEGRNQKPETENQKPKTIVYVYCHTPIRYYWSHYEEYRNMMEFGWLNPLARLMLDLLIGWLRRVDYEAAQRVDFFIANSRTTAERIKKYYNRESEIIYPGVEKMKNEKGKMKNIDPESGILNPVGAYYLGVGRCIPYKKFDLLVEAFNTNGKQLILCTATDTPLFRELQAKSKSNIEWKFRVSNEEKNELFHNAKAFLFPPEEDFGLVPVEAMMMGAPVIAYGSGGATESVIDGETGVFFTPQTPEALNNAIEKSEKMNWDHDHIVTHAENFSKERFQEKIDEYIRKHSHQLWSSKKCI